MTMKRLIPFGVLVPLLVGCGHSWPARADALDELQARVIRVSKSVSPSVVHIEAAVRSNNRGKLVTGSGFVTDASGVIVTNWHVVDRARRVHVVVPGHDGRYPAEVVGTDKQTDLAVLRIEPREGDDPFPEAELGNSDALTVGEWVVAIGNPYGLDGTVSLGIVSVKGRDLQTAGILNDFIQTDAMIDHGSSGGPLLNLKGRVVGVNSRGQGRGIGFTIPINTAKRVVSDLLGEGRIARAYLGVSVQPLDRELARYWDIPRVHGVVIGAVTPGSPAENAGLQVGDIVTHIDAEPVRAEKDEDLGVFQRKIAQMLPGDDVRLRLRRGTDERDLTIQLDRQPKVVPDEEETDFGFTVQELTLGLFRKHRLRTREGVLVSFVERGSEAAEAQLSNGDLIVSLEDRPIATIEDFRAALETLPAGREFLLKALRGDETRFLLVRPGKPTTAAANGAEEADRE
jgi:serine protease Do